jgi:hypothetical protein
MPLHAPHALRSVLAVHNRSQLFQIENGAFDRYMGAASRSLTSRSCTILRCAHGVSGWNLPALQSQLSAFSPTVTRYQRFVSERLATANTLRPSCVWPWPVMLGVACVFMMATYLLYYLLTFNTLI